MPSTAPVLTFGDLPPGPLPSNDIDYCDCGVLFQVRDQLEASPFPALAFYKNAATSSEYARNAIVCTGILSELIQFCRTPANEAVQIATTETIYAILSRGEPFPVDPNDLSSLLDLLTILHTSSLYFVLLTLSEIARTNTGHSLIWTTKKIHLHLAKLVRIESLQIPCLALLGHLVADDRSQLRLLTECGLVEQTIEIALFNRELTALALWVLSNFVQCAADLVIESFTADFMERTVGLIGNGETGLEKDALVFCAAVVVFCPAKLLPVFISEQWLQGLVMGLRNSDAEIRLWCSNAIGRVLIVGKILDCVVLANVRSEATTAMEEFF
jgi:hypothetical protein